MIIEKIENKNEQLLNITTAKKEYTKPQLQAFGDVRDVTLGASLPGTESQTGPNPTCQIGIDPGCQ